MLWSTKLPSMYDIKGRMLGFMAVVAVVAFIILMNGRRSQSQLSPSLSQDSWTSNNKLSRVHIPQAKNATRDFYAIVFDAGSTGSRIHVYQFRKKGEYIKLLDEVFDHIKPGLSAYADKPKEAGESLRKLINLALKVVPSALHRTTPMVLWATAGLRLLPREKADNILNHVRDVFKEYDFLIPDNAVNVMDGIDEGVWSWVTVNFLLKRLQRGQPSVAALDLGGGSTQITFSPQEQASLADKKYVKTLNLMKTQHVLYTRSYLGLGLMSARFTILGGMEVSKDNSKKNKTLTSPCFPAGYSGDWKHNGNYYKVSGVNKADTGFQQCLTNAQQLVEDAIKPVQELVKKDMYIFSYFYDKAADAYMIEKKEGGNVKVNDFEKAARKFFEKPNLQEPFLGLDLTYIYALLHYGYRLSPSDHFVLKKKINAVEVSWGLGAAFQLLSEVGMMR